MLDLHHFAFLATTSTPVAEEAEQGEAKDKEVPRLPFRNVSVFVPTGEKLPQLPLQPFYTLKKAGISVDLVSQEAEERDPAMVATIKKVKDFLADHARKKKPLPVEYDNVHVFRGGDLYVKPSWGYLKKYRLDRVLRTIYYQRTSGLKLRDLLSDLRSLHTLTSSTVWLDMRQNIYKKEYEYLDPSKGYGEQSPIEYRRDCDYEGHCIEKCFYTKRLGNHFILKEEAFSTFDTHLVNCVCIPLEASLSRRSYIRLFHPADDDHLAQADETHTKSYEASDEEKNADEKMAKEMVEIDSAELDDMRRKADIPRWKPVEPFEKKWIVLRPPKGYAPIVLKAWNDTSLLPEVKVVEDDESSDDSDEERYKTLDPEYYDDKRWKASQWADSESEDEDPEADKDMCPPHHCGRECRIENARRT
jgi:hypothetical protein